MSRSDRVIGISLGILIGIAALILFIFLGSGSSIDAPSLETQAPVEHAAGSGSP